MLLMGDFNCSGIDWTNQLTVDINTNSLNNKLIETLRDCYLEQVITENTRARGSNVPSLLDLVLCYDREQIGNIKYLGPLGKSDHCVVTLLYNITFENCSYKVKRNMYDKGDDAAINPTRSRGGGGFKSPPPPLRFFALTHLILERHYCALLTFPQKNSLTPCGKKFF